MDAYDYLVERINNFIDRNNYILIDYVQNWAPRGSMSIRAFYKETEEGTILTKDFEF